MDLDLWRSLQQFQFDIYADFIGTLLCFAKRLTLVIKGFINGTF